MDLGDYDDSEEDESYGGSQLDFQTEDDEAEKAPQALQSTWSVMDADQLAQAQVASHSA